MRPTQLPVRYVVGIKWPGLGADHPLISTADFVNGLGVIPPTFICTCIGMSWDDFNLVCNDTFGSSADTVVKAKATCE